MSKSYDNIQTSVSVAEEAGDTIARILNLKKDSQGFYNTSLGPESSIGLARLIDNVIKVLNE